MKALLLAAMPVVLMDGTAPDLNRWLQIEPDIAAAVECRQRQPLASTRRQKAMPCCASVAAMVLPT